jgi:hypothetical protein
MGRLRSTLAAATLTLGLAAGGAALPAAAVTGGEPDGNGHPNVGLILYYTEEGRFRCSATLVSPTVLLTAAHCTDGTLGSTLVTFESVIAEAPPSPFPVAEDPDEGYTDEELAEAGYLSGTAHTHPDYSDFTDLDTWNDVGVIVLDEPVTNIEPAEIAEVGTLDTIRKSNLARTIFTAVGYGTEVRKADEGPQKPTPMTYPLIRRVADMPGQKLTPQILQTNGNISDTRGTGGTCFGDSGGPVFYQGEVVAVSSYVYTQNCRYVLGFQRVDITEAQDWLATFGL